MPYVSAILLAAGESTRMGKQKALLAWDGVPLIDYQLQQLSGVEEIRQIIVVTGNRPDAIVAAAKQHPRVQVAHNAAYVTGKVSSIKTGLAAVSSEAEAILLLGVDQPRPANVLRTIVQRHIAEGAMISVPVRAGRRGHPVLFARALLPELSAIAEETQGIRAVLERHNADVIEVEFDDPVVHADLNRPEDLRGGGSR
jgi:molybdenum cofactor cytidylyltransferase